MGNITGLTRQGGSAAILAYSYLNGGLSNQLQVVTKGGGAYKSYAYDGNGNATSDGESKGISYNLLNLPLNIKTGGTTLATYVYDAGGNKLRNTGTDGTWDYINGIVYNNKILFVQTEEGRALPNGNIYLYQYYLKDHLGNTRVTFTKNSSGIATNIQENEYYAFGLAAAVPSTPSPANRYLYNGKEVQTDLTNQYDYGARFYDPVIGRFTTIDPLAESDRRWSPYAYGSDNSIRNIDPDGMESEDVNCCGGAKFQAALSAAVDFAAGAGNAIGSDMTGANTSSNYTPSNSAAYNAGINTGHLAAIVQGTVESLTGTVVAIGGAAATIGSGGTASLVSVPVADLGLAVAVHGGFTINNAISNLSSSKGMVNSSSNRAGKDFTEKGKREVINENKQSNGGKTVCQHCGVETTPGQNHKKV